MPPKKKHKVDGGEGSPLVTAPQGGASTTPLSGGRPRNAPEEQAIQRYAQVEEKLGWKTLPLEVCMEAIIDYRGKTPTKKMSGIPLVTAKIIKDGRIKEPTEFISHKDFDSWMTRGLPQPGDIVLTTEAPLGEVAQLDSRKVALAQRVITLRGKSGLLDNTFLKFAIQSEYVQSQMHGRASGSTVSGIKQSELRRVELTLPPFGEQKSIAHILGSLDDKIENNRRMNETLEAMARALFKDWFVDFGPVRAKMEGREPPGLSAEVAEYFPNKMDDLDIPTGWSYSSFGSLLESSIGGDWGKDVPDEEYSVEAAIIRGTDIPDIKNGSSNRVPFRFIRPEKLMKRQLQDRDILIEVSGGSPTQPTGRAILLRSSSLDRFGKPVIPASFCRRFRPLEKANAFLLACHLENLYRVGGTWFYQNQSTGIANFQTTYFLENESVIVPSKRILAAFNSAVNTMSQKIDANNAENRMLVVIRDSLLPRLLSGGLRVNAAEAAVGAS